MEDDRRIEAAVEILNLYEHPFEEHRDLVQDILQEIDINLGKEEDGLFTKDDLCRYYLGDFDFLCLEEAEEDGEVEEDGEGGDESDPEIPEEEVSAPPSPPVEPKQAETFEDIWALVNSLDDGELTRDDLMDVIAYVMPGATQEQVNFEFDLHDINDDGKVTHHEAKHVKHSAHLRDTIELSRTLWSRINGDNSDFMSLDEFIDIYDVLYSLGYAPKEGLDIDD